jgi:hypothetical protein
MNSKLQGQAIKQSPSSKAPNLREARFEDYAQVAALARKFGLGFEGEADWHHLWKGNPAYEEIGCNFPIGWVLEDAEGRICGYLGNVPLHYELEGKRLLVAAPRSWVVDTSYRRYSLMLLGPLYQQANVDLFLSTSVSSHSGLASTLFKNIRVPTGAWDRSIFWITHARGFTESFFTKKRWNVAQPFSYPVSLGLSWRDRLAGSGFRKGLSDPALVPLETFDSRFDDFWIELRKKKAGLLLGVRNRETLDWHFQFALRRKDVWIYTCNGAGGTAGYALFLRQERRQVGLNRVCLVDFQCLDDEKCTAFFMAGLWAAFERCRRESVHMLELIGLPPALQSRAEIAAPHRRMLDHWMYFYKPNDAALGAKLRDPAVWEPWLFDGDSSF